VSYFDDGWVDTKNAKHLEALPAQERDLEMVRRETESFSGKMLSAAYGLERRLDTLIVWHLFLCGQDGRAAFFEDNILRDIGFERKVRLVRNVTSGYALDDLDAFASRSRGRVDARQGVCTIDRSALRTLGNVEQKKTAGGDSQRRF
jgi:hypothetical protein